jgi:hypothetical protein
MATIKIEWLTDDADCETCGTSWAEGARVFVDGSIAVDLEPTAYCCGGAHYDEREVFTRILEHLGHTVEHA